MIASNNVLVRGPSNWKTDNHQRDLNLTRHNIDAAPLNLNLANCRKKQTSRVTCNKKLMGDFQNVKTEIFRFSV